MGGEGGILFRLSSLAGNEVAVQPARRWDTLPDLQQILRHQFKYVAQHRLRLIRPDGLPLESRGGIPLEELLGLEKEGGKAVESAPNCHSDSSSIDGADLCIE